MFLWAHSGAIVYAVGFRLNYCVKVATGVVGRNLGN